MRKEKEKEKNKKEKKAAGSDSIWILPPLLLLLLSLGGSFLVTYLNHSGQTEQVQMLCFVMIGAVATGICVYRFFPFSGMDPEISGRCLKRFWILEFLCLILSFVFSYLPNTTWPFVAVFVLLGVLSTPMIGLVCGSVLLMLTVLLSGGGLVIFLVYFVSGVFALICFLPLRENFRFALPMVLSMGCLLVCQTAGIILTLNARLLPAQFIMPGIGIVVSALLIFVGIYLYSSREIYYYQDLYRELNDIENETLSGLKKQDPKTYLQTVHTAFFCGRIAGSLGMDMDICKCAAYYHRLCPAKQEEREVFFAQMGFTGAVREVLNEFKDNLIRSKDSKVVREETAVLVASQMIVSAVLSLYEKDRSASPDIEKLVDVVFRRFEENGTFLNCKISMAHLEEMKKIFKAEKMYFELMKG